MNARGNTPWWNFVQIGKRGESGRMNRQLERDAILLFRSFVCLLPLLSRSHVGQQEEEEEEEREGRNG